MTTSLVKEIRCPVSPVVICEVKALLRYAADNGLDPEGLIVRPLYESLCKYELHEMDSNDSDKLEAGVQVLVNYGRLTNVTKPVTGRTFLDTEGPSWKLVWPLYLTSWIFLLLVVSNEVLSVWLGDMPEPEDPGFLMSLIDVRRYVLEVCEPFVWGALGSCVYLLKRLSDLAEARCYDRNITSGWAARILLGSILGGVVQYVYDPSIFTAEGLQFKAGAMGFLTGVSVKVVYGAIEKTVSVLAEKLNLDSVIKANRGQDAVRIFLAKELARPESQEEPHRREVLLSLLEQLKRGRPDG